MDNAYICKVYKEKFGSVSGVAPRSDQQNSSSYAQHEPYRSSRFTSDSSKRACKKLMDDLDHGGLHSNHLNLLIESNLSVIKNFSTHV